MATFPLANYYSNASRTEGEGKATIEALLAATKQIPGAATTELALTISGGSITPAGGSGMLVIDTEGGAATDDLTNIVPTNYPDNACLMIRNANASRTVVARHGMTGAGQMFLQRAVAHALDDTATWMALQRRGNDWYEVWRSPARLQMPVVDKAANFNLTVGDCGKVFRCHTFNIAITFDAAAVLGNGWTCTIINDNLVNSVSLDPNGGEAIDGLATIIVSPRSSRTIVCNGSAFFTVGDFHKQDFTLVTFSASLTMDVLYSDYFEVGALTANVTSMTLQNFFQGDRLRIRFIQDATGGRTVALPAGAKVAGSVGSSANQASTLDLYKTFAGSRIEGFWTQLPV